MNPRPLDAITTLIIHCAATPNGKPFTPADIDRWHAERGFTRAALTDREFIHARPGIIHHEPTLQHIGYHFVINLAGGLHNGRHITEVGAHAAGHNRHSIGVCLIGTDQFTPAQWDALQRFVVQQKKAFATANGGEGLRVIGHREVAAKLCPGFDAQAWLASGMAPLAGHVLDHF